MKVEDEWDRDPDAVEVEDLLFVTYEPDKITEVDLVKTIENEGFKAEIR